MHRHRRPDDREHHRGHRDRGHHRGHRDREHHRVDPDHRGHRDHGLRGHRRRRPGTWASSPGSDAACRDDPERHRHERPAAAADAGRHRQPGRHPAHQRPGSRRCAAGWACGPCPGSGRTGCCPDAEHPGDRRAAGRASAPWEQRGREPRRPAPRVARGPPARRASRQPASLQEPPVRASGPGAERPWVREPAARRRQVPPARREPRQRAQPGRQVPRRPVRPSQPLRRACGGRACGRTASGPAPRGPRPAQRRRRRPSGSRRPPCGNASPRAARRSSSPT